MDSLVAFVPCSWRQSFGLACGSCGICSRKVRRDTNLSFSAPRDLMALNPCADLACPLSWRLSAWEYHKMQPDFVSQNFPFKVIWTSKQVCFGPKFPFLHVKIHQELGVLESESEGLSTTNLECSSVFSSLP
jgi:hypothetical protein